MTMNETRPLVLVGGDMGRGDGVDYRARLAAAFPQAEFLSYETDPDVLERRIADASAVIGHVPEHLLPRAARLRWVQTTGAGANAVCTPAYQQRDDVVATTASGVHVASVPEQVLAMVLAFARCLPEQIVNQRGAKAFYWPTPPFEVEGQTMAVLGTGRIGEALARKARGLDMRVVGWRRREPPAADDLFDRWYAPDDLHGALADADHVVITLPLTPDTHRLIGDAELRAMKPTAYLYNVGRGPILDQDALLSALRSGTIAGAGLDVTDPEPLPPDHPLWDEPNVVLLTHYGGLTPQYGPRAYAIVHGNVDRFLSGRPLVNVVDKRRGY
ncbi:D-2-hydroxyacid dehydrogenase [Pseudonocardia kunmingensis]|uniref:Phosphoglycerate dehydrogenase-like enzyme n=1 Tax=Pseudonocardia kunmingensis TaxID=630975 RepID=A0A543DQM3_9PSEU|nr:D-2-hydroxyacid dehydrogenase [Pseudonocardia kunmingensis]TQM11631.1 phosphoglycerate dehydrogenase-like enzyme [Pseudonocardia kunmingensis]